MFDPDKRPMKRLGCNRIENKTMSQPIGPTQPTIGRIVHYTPDGNARVPAIVVQVLSGTGQCVLTVFHSDATESGVIASHVEPKPDHQYVASCTWCWPKVVR